MISNWNLSNRQGRTSIHLLRISCDARFCTASKPALCKGSCSENDTSCKKNDPRAFMGRFNCFTRTVRSYLFFYNYFSIVTKSALFSVCGMAKESVPFLSAVILKTFFFGLDFSISSAVSSRVGSSVKFPSRYAL